MYCVPNSARQSVQAHWESVTSRSVLAHFVIIFTCIGAICIFLPNVLAKEGQEESIQLENTQSEKFDYMNGLYSPVYADTEIIFMKTVSLMQLTVV